MKIIVFLILIFSVTTSYGLDSLYHYYNSDEVFYMNDESLIEAGERFSFDNEVILKGIRFKAIGEKDSKAIVNVYGNEAGNPLPVYENRIFDPIEVSKSKDSEEWIEVDFDKHIKYDHSQLFITVTQNNKLKLITNRKELPPECVSKNCSDFNYQVLKNEDGIWSSGRSAFIVELIVEKSPEDVDPVFKKVEFSDLKINEGIKSITLFDFNDDGLQDILSNRFILINESDFEFKRKEILDSNRNDFANILINDIDGYRIISLSNDSSFKSSIYHFNKNLDDYTVDSVDLSFNIEELQSYSVADINFDNKLDLTLACNDSLGSKIYILKQTDERKFELFDEIRTEPISSITYFDINKNKRKELVLNYLNKGKDIYFFSETGITKDTSEVYNVNKLNTDFIISDIDNDSEYDYVNVFQLADKNIQGNNLIISNEDKIDVDNNFEYDDELFSPLVIDVNNDGYKDIIFTTRCDCRKTKLLIQNTDNSFEDRTFNSGFNDISFGPSIIKADLDNDGKLDFLTLESGSLIGFQNIDKNNNNYISFKTDKNDIKSLELYSDDDKFTTIVSPGGRSLLIQDAQVYHFGLDDDKEIDSVVANTELGRKKLKDYEINSQNDLDELEEQSKETENTAIKLTASPNPFKTNVNLSIESNQSGTLEIKIFNQKGKLIYMNNEEMSTTNINLKWDGMTEGKREVPSGFYLIVAKIGDEIVQNKILKIK